MNSTFAVFLASLQNHISHYQEGWATDLKPTDLKTHPHNTWDSLLLSFADSFRPCGATGAGDARMRANVATLREKFINICCEKSYKRRQGQRRLFESKVVFCSVSNESMSQKYDYDHIKTKKQNDNLENK